MTATLLTEYLFRFILYVALGFTLEICFSVLGVDKAIGFPVKRREPIKYLEGFVSLYMIPVHGLGMLFAFEYVAKSISDFNIFIRYLIYALLITMTEALSGFVYDKIFKFYPWDYYADSKYKVFKRGYTLWTLIPQWGLAGLIFEFYSKLLIHLSPAASNFILGH